MGSGPDVGERPQGGRATTRRSRYLGEFNSGASAISIPITQRGRDPPGLAVEHVRRPDPRGGRRSRASRTSTTRRGKRTFGRVVPADHIQAAAQVQCQKDQGCKATYILNDKEVYGKGIADQVASIGQQQGLQIKGNDGIDTKAANFRALAGKIASSGADCFFFGGIVQSKGVQVFKDVYAANPKLKMFGPDGVADRGLHREGRLGHREADLPDQPDAGPEALSGRGAGVLQEVQGQVRQGPGPVRVYGYEAMAVVLDAIKRAGDKGNDRAAVVKSFFDTKGRESVLGKYDIDENGDTTLTDYGGYQIEGGKQVFDKVIKAPQSG